MSKAMVGFVGFVCGGLFFKLPCVPTEPVKDENFRLCSVFHITNAIIAAAWLQHLLSHRFCERLERTACLSDAVIKIHMNPSVLRGHVPTKLKKNMGSAEGRASLRESYSHGLQKRT